MVYVVITLAFGSMALVGVLVYLHLGQSGDDEIDFETASDDDIKAWRENKDAMRHANEQRLESYCMNSMTISDGQSIKRIFKNNKGDRT